MSQTHIRVRGARVHNLKNLDVDIPRDKLVVITGLSGSGKSSLAFDTIFAEGQRRYVESLSAYARQFLAQMKKPELDTIDGLSPAISIDQKAVSKNPRSTVGTVTEIYDYMRVLFANIGIPHCPVCGRRIARQSAEEICDQIRSVFSDTGIVVLSPVVRDRKGEYSTLLRSLKRQGYTRVRIDAAIEEIDDALDTELDRYKKHTIEAVVDRLVFRGDDETRSRLTDAVEMALEHSDGFVSVLERRIPGVGNESDTESDTKTDTETEPRYYLFSEAFGCARCGVSLEELTPRMFSFNSPHGACPKCHGLGYARRVTERLIVPDPSRSIVETGFIPPGFGADSYSISMIESVARHYEFDIDQPWRELPDWAREIILYGSNEEHIQMRLKNRKKDYMQHRFYRPFEGVITTIERRYKETSSSSARARYEKYMMLDPCVGCKGQRLRDAILAVTVGGKNISAITALSIGDALAFFNGLEEELSPREQKIANEILKEIRERLQFMANVGLEYLTLDRISSTLSGGESQRIRLATQIGSKLMGVLYILDEPSIGLHLRDHKRLLATLEGLRDVGNTVIVVEHDETTIRSADWVVDLGPGAGDHGGEVVADGPVDAILAEEASLTGAYLRGDRAIEVPEARRDGNDRSLTVLGAAQHNLKRIDVGFPLGKFVCVTGVSGSGKSTLVNNILYRALARKLHRAHTNAGAHDGIEGVQYIDKVIIIDQSPIGRTPRSNPATYTGVFTPIREIFAQTVEARKRGYKKGRFSFNVRGGRCEACGGAGMKKIEMHFLPDIYVPCEVCNGKRFNRETLQVKFKGKTIYDVLEMTVEEALELFAAVPKIKRRLQTIYDVGLGYLQLGQPAPTLSGGEAQRVKLSSELSRRSTGKTFYILDEPTTGLHFGDIEKLLAVLSRLADAGNTVVVIEHNLDVIKCADWIVDLGPEGGEEGGEIVAEGTPEELTQYEGSYTGRYLRRVLDIDPETAGNGRSDD